MNASDVARARPPATRTRRSRARLWAVLSVTIGAMLMALGFGGAMVTQAYLHSLSSSVETGSVLDDTTMKQAASSTGKTLRGPIDLLLLGLDTRSGWAENSSRADTIIVLHVPASHDQAYLMSIPRDALVSIPAYPKANFFGATTRANAAFVYGSRNGQGWQGGAALTAKMINQLTGIRFDGVAVIDFGGFRNIIEALGGVHMCVDHETRSDHYLVVNGKPVYAYGKRSGVFYSNSFVHHVGCRDMEGWEALDFARQRKSGPYGDYDRQRHQQQLLKAMGEKATTAGVITNPIKINSLIKAAGGALKVDTGRAKLTDFIWTLKGIASGDLVMLKTNGGIYNRAKVKGTQAFTLESMQMFQAAQRDELGQFALDHPNFVISDHHDD
jgi:LCP family protein required for cell wall assembly